MKIKFLFPLLFFVSPLFSQTNVQWRSTYNGSANAIDIANEVIADTMGNVYVAGRANAYGSSDFVTIKYDVNGNLLWSREYNHPGNDEATGIAVDGWGNVFVTGYCQGVGGYDIMTIKYDANGNFIWVRTYDGSAGANDQAYDIAVDFSGNIYVTGYSTETNTGADYILIHWDWAGNLDWVEHMQGTAPGNDDFAQYVKCDVFGVYVTGYAIDQTPGNYSVLTVKYDYRDGTEQWRKYYHDSGTGSNYPAGLSLDQNYNVVVAGRGSGDFSTIKYDLNGTVLWSDQCNGPYGMYDGATALTVDNFGNVIVTGRSTDNTYNDNFMTVKYDPTGIRQWISMYQIPGQSAGANGVVADAQGNIYVAGSGADDMAMVKYNSSGTQVFVDSYNGSASSSDAAYSICKDGSENVIMSGFATNVNSDIVTIKYLNQFTNSSPIAHDEFVNVGENNSLNFSLAASDPDNDPISFVFLRQPTFGTISGAGPNLVYTPNHNFVGIDTLTYYAADPHGAQSSVAIVSIAVYNHTPIANHQNLSTGLNALLNIMLTGTDPDSGDVLTYSVSSVLNGTITGTPPNIIFTPYFNFYGNATIQFVVRDQYLATSLVETIDINVYNGNYAPTAYSLVDSTNQNIPKTINLFAVDPEGDAMIYTITAAPSYGSLSGTGANRTYTPNLNFTGADQFSYTATDVHGNVSSPAIFSISVLASSGNHAPVGNDDFYCSNNFDNGNPIQFNAPSLLANDYDLENDTLTAIIFQPAGHGYVNVHPDGSFSYLPNFNFSGNDVFYYKAVDSHGAQSTPIIVRLTIYTRPTISIHGSQQICEGDSVPLIASSINTSFYSWSTGETTQSIMAHNAGVYYVVEQGCPNIQSIPINISVLPKPNVVAGTDFTYCSGLPVMFAASGAQTYTWSPSSSLIVSNLYYAVSNATTSTAYVVTGTDAHGCKNTDTINVFRTLLTVNAGSDMRVCMGSTNNLMHASFNESMNYPVAFSWSPATGLSSTTI